MFALTVAGGTVLFGASHAQAQSNTNKWSGLVEMVAQKFNLDKTQVQAVFDEYHNSKRQNMMKYSTDKMSLRLDKLVEAGKITTDQKDAILDKLAELRSKYELDSLQNLSPDERREKMQAMHDEMSDWAEENGIEFSEWRAGWNRKYKAKHFQE